MRITNILIILFTLFFLSIGNSVAKEVSVTIFHLNDLHSHINNLAKISKIVNDERRKNKNVYFFNIGDNFSGNPVVDMYEPKGEPLLILYKLMKFDVMTLGNHDFDYGKKTLRRFLLKSSFKTICANIEDRNGWLPNVSKFTILKTKEGIKIVLLGIIQIEKDTYIPSTHPKNVTGLLFKDELKTIRKYKSLKEKNNSLIILSHMGIESDVKTAMRFNWVDIIIGGHSHTIIKHPKEFNGVLITQAGSKGRYLGRIDLVFKDKKLIDKKASLINLYDIRAYDPHIKTLIDEFNNNDTLNKIVRYLPFKLRGKRALGNMICDAIINSQTVDIAFMNKGGIRLSRLNKKIKIKDIYTMHPFNNNIIVFYLSPEEIRGLIEISFKKRGKIDLFTAGISYKIYVDENNKNINRIILKDRKGKLLNESRKYSVGISNYVASAYKFPRKDYGKSTNISLAEIVIDFIKNTSKFKNYKKIRRAQIVSNALR